jgi:YD repeat-containing protein
MSMFGALVGDSKDTGLKRFGVLVLAALIAGWSTSASAQFGDPSTDSSPPAEKFVVSAGGVDMRTGRYAYDMVDLSIGESNESGGLAFKRSLSTYVVGHSDPFGNFSHNWDVFITIRPVDIANGQYNGYTGPDERAAVRFGGRSDSFEKPGNLTQYYQISRENRSALTYTGVGIGAVYTMEASDGTLVTFRPVSISECSTLLLCAFASHIVTPDGTRFDLSYDTGSIPRLRRVSSSRGYVLLLEYSGSSSLVTKTCVLSRATLNDPTSFTCPGTALATTSYTYTTYGSKTRLATATDAVGGVYNFGYAAASGGQFTMAYTKPGQPSPWLTNTVSPTYSEESGEDEVITYQSFADGGSYTYYYDQRPFVEGQPPSIAGGRYINAQGGVTFVTFGFPPRPGQFTNNPNPINFGGIDYQLTPGPVEVIDPDGKSWKSDYCDPNVASLPPGQGGCLVSTLRFTEDPEGNRTEYTIPWSTRNVHQVRRKAKAGTGLPDIVTSATYDCSQVPINQKLCGKPSSTTDAKGNVTTFTYDATHGGVLTQTSPAVGGITPQKRYEYAQRYAWVKNSAGTFVQSANPMWVLVRERYCKTTAPSGQTCAGGANDEVVTDFDYGPNSGPNTLLLRGILVTATNSVGTLEGQRTCYGYDDFGRRISETKALANLASCP